jgi:hypothetical protein
MVSIRKANRVTPAIKMKRQSSIRRLASKLGAKAARREALVYKPSGNTVPEDQANDKQHMSMATESSGTRQSHRLLQQQQQQEEPGEKTRQGATPSNSKLRKKDNRDSSSNPANNKKGQANHKADIQVKTSGGAIPPLSLKMADWEIAPGRIRMGTGDTAESEYLPPVAFGSPRFMAVTHPVCLVVIRLLSLNPPFSKG